MIKKLLKDIDDLVDYQCLQIPDFRKMCQIVTNESHFVLLSDLVMVEIYKRWLKRDID